MKIVIFRETQVFSSNDNVQFLNYGPASLFLVGSQLNFSSPKTLQMKASQNTLISLLNSMPAYSFQETNSILPVDLHVID